MFLIRDVMYCKPGQARPMVEKFKTLGKLLDQKGVGKMKVMTDFTAERYWTVVSEMEVQNLEEYTEMSRQSMQTKEFQDVMKGYHDLVESGRREIYVLEA